VTNGPNTDKPELEVGARAALRERNFRLFFIGGMISNAGRWMSNITLPFVLFELTGLGRWVGIAALAQLLPSALMGPLAGSLSDRYPRKNILLISQFGSALVAITFALMWSSDVREPAAYVGVSVAAGIIGGLGIPSWQAFLSQLVPRHLLLSAVTLNSTQFNAARAVGPVIAGAVLKLAGPTWTFTIDAISFVVVIGALLLIDVKPRPAVDRAGRKVAGELVDTVRYIRRHDGLKSAVQSIVFVAGLGMPIVALTVIFADDVFEVGAGWLGIMTAAIGVGAVLATPVVSSASKKIPRSTMEWWSLVLYSISIFAFAIAPVLGLALVALLFVGVAHIVTAATLNTTIQLQVEEHMRGKVLSVYLMTLLVSIPFGQFAMASLGDAIGIRWSTAGGACILLLGGIWLKQSGRLSHLDDEAINPAE
jgi:MFS family permease